MSEQHRRPDERRLRSAAVTAASRQAPGPTDSPEEHPEVSAARSRRAERQAQCPDFQVSQAMARGDFDNLPGAGKPIRGLGGTHDPQWWVKGLIEREQITGVGPPALALRKEDAELDARLDRESTDEGVRGLVEDFNHRVVEARRQLLGGPPVITPTRNADHEVEAWRARRAERQEQLRRQRAGDTPAESETQQGDRRPRWSRRRRPRRTYGVRSD